MATNWITIGATVSVATATLLGIYFFTAGNGVGDDEPVLSIEDTTAAMAKILEGLRSTAAQYARAAQNIKEQLAAQGQSMTDEQIMTTIILPHFKNAFQTMQAEVLESFDVDEEELEESVVYYLENEEGSKLSEVVAKVRLLCAEFTGQSDSDLDAPSSAPAKSGRGNESLTLERLIEVLQDFAERTYQDVDAFTANFVGNYGIPKAPDAIYKFHEELSSLSERTQSEVLEIYGLSKTDFESGIVQNQNAPQLQQVIMQMQAANHEILRNHGIDQSQW